jgi:hypothetical protein
LIDYYNKLIKSKNFPKDFCLSSSGILDRCQSLVEYNMIRLSKNIKFTLQTISLNVSKDDVQFALKDREIFDFILN